jgi:hypothetical protein
MSDQKFQLRYSAGEDRVLIISGAGGGDMRCFALTRRMVGQLWPGMNKVILAISPRARAARPPATMAPEQGAIGLSPATGAATAAAPGPAAPAPVRPDAPNPLGTPQPGEERHLVRKLQLVDRGGHTRLLVLTAASAELRVPLDNRQLTQIYEALRVVIARADWGIDLDAGLPDAVAPPQPPQDTSIDITSNSPSRYRH